MKLTLQQRSGDRVTVLMMLEVPEGANVVSELRTAMAEAGLPYPDDAEITVDGLYWKPVSQKLRASFATDLTAESLEDALAALKADYRRFWSQSIASRIRDTPPTGPALLPDES